MSRIGRVCARLALRLHPAPWQDRYGDEMADLIESSDSSLADAADLVRSAVHHQTRRGAPMRIEPAQRHPGLFAAVAAVVLLPTLGVVSLSIIGHELGVASVARVVDPWLTWVNTVRVVDLALVAAPALAFLLAVLPLVDLRFDAEDATPVLNLRVRAVAANLVVGTLALLVGVALVAHIVTESVLQLGP